MTTVAVVAPSKRKRAGRGEPSASQQASTNNVLAGLLIAIVFFSTLFFGSVHPFAWGTFAIVVGAGATWYCLTMMARRQPFRVPLRSMSVQLGLFVLLCAYLVVQMLPLGILSAPLASAGGVVVESQTISIAPNMTLLMLMRQLSYGVFFFLILQVSANEGRRRVMTNVLLVIAAGYAALGIVSLQLGDTVLGVPKTSYQGFATGPFVNRNSFATFLGFGAIIALSKVGAIVVSQRQRHVNDGLIAGLWSSTLLYGVAYLILLGTIVATQSRMGLIATTAASLLVVYIVIWKAELGIKSAIGLTVMLAAALVLGLVFYGENLFDRVITTGQSTEQRGDLYAQVWELIRLRPWTGFGGGSFELAFPLVHHDPVSSLVTWSKAHSSYLALWSELGLIGGSIPLLVLALVAFRLLTALLKNRGNWVAQAIALGVLILAAIHSTIDFSLEIQANTFLFLALLGMGVGSIERPR